MKYDLWFARFEGDLYAVTTKPGQSPTHRARKVRHAGDTLRRVKEKGHEVVQVGICPPDMLGLE